MRRIAIIPGRPHDPRLFWVLAALNLPATFAILPFAIFMRGVYGGAGAESAPSWANLLVDRVVNLALIMLLARIGLSLARNVGLGLPFLSSRLAGTPPPHRARALVAMGVIVGFGCASIIMALDFGVFQAHMTRMLMDLGIEIPQGVVAPPVYGFLAAVSAGITEETVFRLFGVSLLVWLGRRMFQHGEGPPHRVVLWVAGFLVAVLFAAAHLLNAKAMGLPVNGLILSRTLVLNGLAGVAFSWLFWTYGLESAMLAHFFTDIGLYVLLPIVILQEAPVATTVAGVFVAAFVVFVIAWAGRTIAEERKALGSE